MPWIPKPDAIRRLREQRSYSTWELAHKTNLAERQIRKLESKDAPKTMRLFTVRSLSAALDCDQEEIATWVDRRVRARRVPGGKKLTARAIARDNRSLKRAGIQLFQMQDMGAIERQLRLRGQTKVETFETADGGTVELLGPERINEIQTQFGAYADQRFVLLGRITQHRPIGHEPAKRIGTQSGVGAQFQLVRELIDEVWFYTTVFTNTPEHTRRLIDGARDPLNLVCLIAHVHVARPKYAWRGFTLFEREMNPCPFALVVDYIVPTPNPKSPAPTKLLP